MPRSNPIALITVQGYPFVTIDEDVSGLVDVQDEEEEEDEEYRDDEDEEQQDDEDEDEEEDEDEVDGAPVVRRPWLRSSRVSYDNVGGSSALMSHDTVTTSQGLEAVAEQSKECDSRTQGGEMSPLGSDSQEGEFNRGEIDGLFCPICMEAWTNAGDHKICCLPCGHIYGFSCISKWLQQRRSSGKCPQCNKKCKLKDVRVLYASRLHVVDEEMQKKVRSLEAKCVSLEKKGVAWYKKEVEWQKREAGLTHQIRDLKERTNHLERALEDEKIGLPGEVFMRQAAHGINLGTDYGMQTGLGSFTLQKEFQIDGARFFDVDVASQIFIIARRLSGTSGTHVLTKMGLISPHERENIQLPPTMKAVKDLCVSPQGRLALLASLGKKLSILSLESNNTILTYDLQAVAWSCSWSLNSSHYLYAGLQNGMVLEFDIRQTRGPVESLYGLTSNPVHTICPLSQDLDIHSGVRTLLTASSVGLCEWNFGDVGNRSFLVPGSENQGVCISLACCPRSNDVVATFRPKVDMSEDVPVSQPLLSPSASVAGQAVQGSHVLYKRLGNRNYQKLGYSPAYVNHIRLPKSAIIDQKNCTSFLAGDEMACDLVMHELPSLAIVQHFKSQKHPIRALRYTQLSNSGILGCLTDGCLQLYSNKPF